MLSKDQLCLPKSKSWFGNTIKRWENHLFGKKQNFLFTILHPCDMSWISTTLYYISYYISLTSAPQKLRDQISSKRLYPATPQNSSFSCFDCQHALLTAWQFCWWSIFWEMLIQRAPFKGCQLLPPTKSGFFQGHGLLESPSPVVHQ